MTVFLTRIAKQLYRTPEEARIGASSDAIRVKDALFYGALFVLAVSLMPFMLNQVFRSGGDMVEVPVALTEWHALYEESAPCPLDARASTKANVGCFANPANPALWTSPHSRAQQKHRTEAFRRRYKELWIGVTIPGTVLQQAAARLANQFVLGWVRGTYKIWVDGDYLIGGKWSDNEPLVLPTSMGRLQAGRPLHIAIQIINDAGIPGTPDVISEHVGSGFARKETAASWRRTQGLQVSARPMSLFIANLLLAVLFFLVWSVSREKQEHFYIALYAFANALIQLKRLDFFYLALSPTTLNTYGLVVACYYSISGMFVGFAFARMRPAVFRWGIPAALLLPLAIAAWIRDPVRQLELHALFYQGFGCFFAAVGAASCWLQAWLLHTQRRGAVGLPVRERRLLYFGGALALIAANCFFDQGLFVASIGKVFLLLVLGALALRDYHEERLLLQKAPVSPYHRHTVIPDSVTGAMLVIDLKNSERLFRAGSELGRGGELVDICISHLSEVAAELKGLVIQTEGDFIRVFFDSAVVANPSQTAINACDAVFKRLQSLQGQLQMQFLLRHEIQLEFRAAIAVGSIRPVWHEIGTVRYAGWVEAGTDNSFAESMRLMDLDHYLPTRSTTLQSRLVLLEAHAAQLCEQRPELAARFTARNLVLRGKYGQDYCVAFYLPSAGAARELKRVA
ncbi:MAG: hypothetical protein HY074_20885 [Deltaproteobacteria bacterium]|nr:hypothetical protein [Deltaproteobacteria bacterium]